LLNKIFEIRNKEANIATKYFNQKWGCKYSKSEVGLQIFKIRSGVANIPKVLQRLLLRLRDLDLDLLRSLESLLSLLLSLESLLLLLRLSLLLLLLRLLLRSRDLLRLLPRPPLQPPLSGPGLPASMVILKSRPS